MSQAERDRLVALKKANKRLITQKQAAEEIGVTERQVRRLLRKLRSKGDHAVIHELRGRPSNRKFPGELEQRAITVLADPVHRGFGPALAAEYLEKKHEIAVSKETGLLYPISVKGGAAPRLKPGRRAAGEFPLRPECRSEAICPRKAFPRN